MSQISPPIRIFLAVAVLFVVAWMTVLKPKAAEDVSAPTPITTGNVAAGKPAVSAIGKLDEKAKGAASASEKQSAAAAGETGSTPAAGTATKPAPATAKSPGTKAAASGDLAGLPAPAAKAILKQEVLVIGFFSAKAADDRDVRKAMFKTDRWNGRVFVTAAPIAKVSAWGRIARGVDVQQSPTVVVVGTDLKATPLVGYVDTQTINQAVVDSLHNTGGLFTNHVMGEVNQACASATSALYATPTPGNQRQLVKGLDRNVATLSALVHDLRAVKVGAPLKSFKRAMVADATTLMTATVRLDNALSAKHVSTAQAATAIKAFDKDAAPAGKRFDKRAKQNHLLSCVD